MRRQRPRKDSTHFPWWGGPPPDLIHCLPHPSSSAQLAASEPEPKVLSADRGSFYVRLGDLAPAFRQRAFEHALSHLQHGQFQVREALAQLRDSCQLVSPTPFPGVLLASPPPAPLCWVTGDKEAACRDRRGQPWAATSVKGEGI